MRYATLRSTGSALGLALLVVLAACVPAGEPPQLAATPGPAAVVTEDLYDAGVFRVRYPEGWRVITSPAESPPFVIFVAPDECAVIMVSVDEAEAPEPQACEEQTFMREERDFPALSLSVSGIAAEAQGDQFLEHFEQVISTIETGDSG